MASGRDFLGAYRLIRLIRAGQHTQVWEVLKDGETNVRDLFAKHKESHGTGATSKLEDAINNQETKKPNDGDSKDLKSDAKTTSKNKGKSHSNPSGELPLS